MTILALAAAWWMWRAANTGRITTHHPDGQPPPPGFQTLSEWVVRP